MYKCDTCECKELCQKVIQAGATGVSCKEMLEMIQQIIEKRVDK